MVQGIAEGQCCTEGLAAYEPSFDIQTAANPLELADVMIRSIVLGIIGRGGSTVTEELYDHRLAER